MVQGFFQFPLALLRCMFRDMAGGRFVVGTPDEVMRTEVLSALYGTRVDVVRIGDRLVVLGTEDGHHCEDGSAGG